MIWFPKFLKNLEKSLNTRVDIQMFNEMTLFPLSYCSVCFWSWGMNQREKAWQILYKTVTSVFFCSEEADFTLSCQCFSSFSFLPLKIHNFWKTWKCKAKLYLFFFLLFYFISCFVGLSSGRFGSEASQLMHQSVYWRFKDGKIRATKYSDKKEKKTKKKTCISQKPAFDRGELVCVAADMTDCH